MRHSTVSVLRRPSIMSAFFVTPTVQRKGKFTTWSFFHNW